MNFVEDFLLDTWCKFQLNPSKLSNQFQVCKIRTDTNATQKRAVTGQIDSTKTETD